MNPFQRRGFILLAFIILLVFASLAVLGVTFLVTQRLSFVVTQQIQASCIDLAHAGIHQAIYFYRERDRTGNGYFSLGQTNIDANNFFVLGGGGSLVDLLMVNTSQTRIQNRFLNRLYLQNATNSQPITIDSMLVTWTNPNPQRRLNRIRIRPRPTGGWTTVWSNGGQNGGLFSPVNANISDYSLNTTPSTYEVELRFSGNLPPDTTIIDIQFSMTDGSTKALRVYNGGAALNNFNFNFTVRSTGRTSGSNIYRTISAEYNALTGRIISYNEIN